MKQNWKKLNKWMKRLEFYSLLYLHDPALTLESPRTPFLTQNLSKLRKNWRYCPLVLVKSSEAVWSRNLQIKFSPKGLHRFFISFHWMVGHGLDYHGMYTMSWAHFFICSVPSQDLCTVCYGLYEASTWYGFWQRARHCLLVYVVI